MKDIKKEIERLKKDCISDCSNILSMTTTMKEKAELLKKNCSKSERLKHCVAIKNYSDKIKAISEKYLKFIKELSSNNDEPFDLESHLEEKERLTSNAGAII